MTSKAKLLKDYLVKKENDKLMAVFNVTTDVYTHLWNSIFEFGNPESHQQIAVPLEINDPLAYTTVEGDGFPGPGRQIVRQGTVWPSDDVAAQGLLMWHYDVTTRGHNAALVHWGDVNLYRIENAAGTLPSAEALRVLHERMGIRFHPHTRYLSLVAGTVTPTNAIVGDGAVGDGTVG